MKKLSDLLPEELWLFWRYIHFNPKKAAKEIFPERQKGYVRATKDLGNWASNVATFINTEDKRYIDIADRIYNKLPEYAKSIVY